MDIAELHISSWNWVKESRKDTRIICDPMMRTQGSNEEVVLFAVVFVFLVSSVPRLVLNLYEVFVISMIQNSCFRLPSWVLVMTSVSALLITLNSSLNFIIYCAMCRNFREEEQKENRAVVYIDRPEKLGRVRYGRGEKFWTFIFISCLYCTSTFVGLT